MKEPRVPQTQLAQRYWHQLLTRGADDEPAARGFALDATAGNGNDALKLAEWIGPEGRVWAFDVQAAAIYVTDQRLRSAGLRERVELIHSDHADWPRQLPPAMRGKLDLVVFNLGFLPKSDSRQTTLSNSTLKALDPVPEWLRPGGMLSVLCYPGHAEGAEETVAVKRWIRKHRSDFASWVQHIPLGRKTPPPELHVLVKR
ncbi:MAG: methyltransferase domain-containing protein [Opitutales bacterium]|nr:methyltransferase domain-containing protein [Opitutales bacterium]